MHDTWNLPHLSFFGPILGTLINCPATISVISRMSTVNPPTHSCGRERVVLSLTPLWLSFGARLSFCSSKWDHRKGWRPFKVTSLEMIFTNFWTWIYVFDDEPPSSHGRKKHTNNCQQNKCLRMAWWLNRWCNGQNDPYQRIYIYIYIEAYQSILFPRKQGTQSGLLLVCPKFSYSRILSVQSFSTQILANLPFAPTCQIKWLSQSKFRHPCRSSVN